MALLLLVDDDARLVRLMRTILEDAGHQVETANGVSEALELAARRQPDVLITDLRLPEVEDGVRLIREISVAGASRRIMVISGWTEDLADRPERDLAHRVLLKPVRTEVLLQSIQELLA